MSRAGPRSEWPPAPSGARTLLWQRLVKRAVDIVLAALILVLAAPVMVAAAVAVLISEGRPVLFRQERVGRNGVGFRIYKFRTMVRDAERRKGELEAHNERTGPLFKLADDPRVTPIGKLLRDSSIDELPQLFNVIKGDMSLVGPRPALTAETEQFHEDHYRTRHLVRPGITGLWQVQSREAPSFESYAFLDWNYVETWTLRRDLDILLRTVPAVLGTAYRRLQARRGQGRHAPGDGPLRQAQPVPRPLTLSATRLVVTAGSLGDRLSAASGVGRSGGDR